jgi:hypothetical protein
MPDAIRPIIVETGPLKNKSIIPVPFFEARKVAAGWPALPRIPPQIHHQNTTFYPHFPPKPLQNTINSHSKKKLQKSHPWSHKKHIACPLTPKSSTIQIPPQSNK